MATNTPATTKQMEYLAELLTKRKLDIVLRARPDAQRETREEWIIQERAAIAAFSAVFASIVIPAEMDAARASRWIDLLKNNVSTIVDKMLDNPKIAQSMGVPAETLAAITDRLFKLY